MAVITAKTWVLRGVCVLRDAKAGEVRLGTRQYQGLRQAPTIPFSMRHPSPGCHLWGIEPPMRHDHVDHLDADQAALRAGRPDSLAGVLVRRSSFMERPRTDVHWPRTANMPNRLSNASKRTTVKRTLAASMRRGTGA
jgi:hypothetical protein